MLKLFCWHLKNLNLYTMFRELEGGEEMTIRAYLSRVLPPESFSMEQKRETIQLERKNVERVLFRPDMDLMVFYDKEGKEEAFVGTV